MQQCLEAEPVPIVSSIPAEPEPAEQRGRDGSDAMAVEQQQQQPKAAAGKKKGRKGVKVAAAAGKKGVLKKKGAKALLDAQFKKKLKKMRR